MRLLIDGLLERVGRGEGGGLKLDVQGQGSRIILDVDAQRGWGVLKIRQFSWTSYAYRPLLHIHFQKTPFVDVLRNRRS